MTAWVPTALVAIGLAAEHPTVGLLHHALGLRVRPAVGAALVAAVITSAPIPVRRSVIPPVAIAAAAGAWGQITAAATDIRKASPSMTEAQAIAKACADNPALYSAYKAEQHNGTAI